jgi:hypothetical protein
MTGEPCPCAACVVAGVDRPSVTLPGEGHPGGRYYRAAKELHGVELIAFYRAQDQFRAALAPYKPKARPKDQP